MLDRAVHTEGQRELMVQYNASLGSAEQELAYANEQECLRVMANKSYIRLSINNSLSGNTIGR